MNQKTKDKATIRLLNDQFRCFQIGRGTITITAGVQAEGETFMAEALAAVSSFDRFNTDNDPWQEHNLGAISVGSEKLFWKIDYYDLAMEMHSPNPADPAVTHRVLTIMLASEY